MSSSTVIWKLPARANAMATLSEIEPFSARGMRRVYGRGDRYPGRAAFNLDIWRDRAGRLLAKFSSRSSEVDDESWAIHGVPDSPLRPGQPLNERSVPDCLREKYVAWLVANF